MSKVKNYVIYREDPAELKRLQGEYESLGRQTLMEDGRLIVLALPKRQDPRR